jgi:hypothetical protein
MKHGKAVTLMYRFIVYGSGKAVPLANQQSYFERPLTPLNFSAA